MQYNATPRHVTPLPGRPSTPAWARAPAAVLQGVHSNYETICSGTDRRGGEGD